MAPSPVNAKYILFASNAVVTIVGLILVILAILDLLSVEKAVVKISATKEFYFNIGIGILAILITPLGWYGGSASNKYMVGAYVALMFIVAVLGISNVRILITLGSQVDEASLAIELRRPYASYTTDEEIRASIDAMQIHYTCCGPDRAIKVGESYPVSCCKVLEDGKCLDPSPQSCAYAITESVHTSLRKEATLGIIFGCLAGVSSLAAFSLLRNMPKT